jgi:tRNA threonylcarbamoyladenosine biosynthesis protein TsaE
VGRNLKGGEIIELTSDLGGGKTTFVRGLARGVHSTDHVSSPTFKISNVYRGSSLEVLHYDFYRLPEAGLMRHELADVLGDPKAVMVVEWADIIEDVLPGERLRIHLAVIGDNQRRLEFRGPPSLTYLLAGLA